MCYAPTPFVFRCLDFAVIGSIYLHTVTRKRLPNLFDIIYCGRNLVVWVLRLVSVDVVILTLWMILDGPHKGMTREVYGYAGEPAAHVLARFTYSSLQEHCTSFLLS